ncbi:hypothetical protein AVEN_31683-1 [Araneus ventricosus]|uniref:Uncharacterized protein n=1 Tax=Araneus ventricosus TaxID=182803 RepID=A0A4Y2RL58_ARAVE|nr:hypothetical protein AVEN_31683-1 [Araneus ventricosus]
MHRRTSEVCYMSRKHKGAPPHGRGSAACLQEAIMRTAATSEAGLCGSRNIYAPPQQVKASYLPGRYAPPRQVRQAVYRILTKTETSITLTENGKKIVNS